MGVYFTKRNVCVRPGQLAEYGCGAAVIFIAIYYPYLGKLFRFSSIEADWFRDFGILINLSDWVVEHGHYLVGGYFYPPPNVIFMRAVSRIGAENAFRLHLIAQSVAFIFTLTAWSRIIEIHLCPAYRRIQLCACVAALFYLSFELEMHNINMLCLGLVSVALWLNDRPWVSGILFAGALANKPYGLLLIWPWMLWHRQFEWCRAAAVWTIVFMIVLPFVYFGVEQTFQLYHEWLQSVAKTADPEWIRAAGFSMQLGYASLFAADISDTTIRFLTYGTEIIWLLMLGCFFLPVISRREMPRGKVIAAEIAALLIAPLPLGGLQQIARSAVFLVATLSIASAVFELKTSHSWRIVLILILVVVAIAPRVFPLGQIQTLVTMALCVLILFGLAMTRALAERDQPVAGGT